MISDLHLEASQKAVRAAQRAAEACPQPETVSAFWACLEAHHMLWLQRLAEAGVRLVDVVDPVELEQFHGQLDRHTGGSR